MPDTGGNTGGLSVSPGQHTAIVPHNPNLVPKQSTLLPRPVSSLITLVTQSTSLSLRLGTYVGGFAIDSARATTLTSLELSRAVVEGILIRAGRDVVSRSSDEHGRAETESLLERSLATLHWTITSASFFASASFHLSSVTLSSFSSFSQSLLSTLDSILGSTESSRAIASIVTLVRKEFKNPETGSGGGNVGIGDLLVGSVGYALLQRRGRRKTEREIRENGSEETIWDVVILDNGLRADVVGTQQTEYANEAQPIDNQSMRPASFLIPEQVDENGNFEAIERDSAPLNSLGRLVPHVALPADRQHELSDEEIRHYIVNQLPQGSHASIKTDTVTARTITVDIFDHDGYVEIAPPPGTALVKESYQEIRDEESDTAMVAEYGLPKHTVVFQTASNQSEKAELHHDGSCSANEMTNDRRSRQTRKRKLPAQAGDSSPLPSIELETTEAHQPYLSRRSSIQSVSSASSLSGSETPKHSLENGPVSTTKQAGVKFLDKMPFKKLSKGLPRPSFGPDDPGAAAKGLSKQKQVSNCQAVDYIPQLDESSSLPAETHKFSESDTVHPGEATNKSRQRIGHSRHLSHPGYCLSRGKSVESFAARTDAYSLRHSGRTASSPSVPRSHVHSTSSLSRVTSEKDMSRLSNDNGYRPSPTASRRNSTLSLAPSIYSVAESDSKASLVLAPRFPKNIYEDHVTMSTLSRDGKFPGLFPKNHLVQNIQRFSRFSSASYGSNFLRVMGISTGPQQQYQNPDTAAHREHHSFLNHTGLPASTILLSSFVDPTGGVNASGKPSEGFPLVHFLTLDHDSKAVVLTLRGTLGFEDILTDMTCDYDSLRWMGRTWQAHKGMHASARRLLEGGSGRVMATIKVALEEFPDYGVVFCGHSLGGGVAALLAVLISRPNNSDTTHSFVTASPADSPNVQEQPGQFCLPSGRPIHVYAYGPPAVMCPSLRQATRGLVTTIVNGQDVVPTLSLGVLHDFNAVSRAFKSDVADAKSQVKSQLWDSISRAIASNFYVNQPPLLIHAGDEVGEDSWAWSTLKSLRAQLTAPKLVPPGEVFVVDTMRVLQRDAFTMDTASGDGSPRLGRPATRVQLRFIRDVESRFGEVRFGSGMLGDHSPGRYEASLAALARGVLED